jgi:hypothetical protein
MLLKNKSTGSIEAPMGEGKQPVACLKRVSGFKFKRLVDVICRSGFGTLF